ncbi:MAG TPA: LPXTG cell wall anchor domain-containing protein [Bacteroidota bacterium]|nr:LPXTG cell wall anchor domain-containing protein [Bacteroidota bacterium]
MILLFALLLNVLEVDAQEVKVTATVDSTTFKIGEWIDLTLKVTASSGVESVQPNLTDSLGQFEVLNVERLEPDAWMIRLTTFDTGSVFIPPIEASYGSAGDTTQHRTYSNSVFVHIVAPPVDLQADIRDIKPPLDAPWLFEDYLPYLIILGLILLGVLAYFYFRKRRKSVQPETAAKPPIPPHTLALIQLRDLEDKRLWQQGKVKEYYSEVTEIIRRFFDGRFGIPALELTSDEVLQHMKKIAEAQHLFKQLQSFFTTADLVKFAKYEPTPAEHENELKIAYEIVRTMMPRVTVEEQSVEETANVR